jgi:hypothetical protein
MYKLFNKHIILYYLTLPVTYIYGEINFALFGIFDIK